MGEGYGEGFGSVQETVLGWWVWFRGIHAEGFQYVGCLVVRGWFLKWNCFFMVLVRQLADFSTRWCVEVGGVGTKLKPKVSTSVSMGDSWWEERFLMALFLKLSWSSWRVQCFLFLKFLIVRISGKSFLNEGFKYGRLGCAFITKFLEPSLQFLLMYASKKGEDIWWRSRCLVSGHRGVRCREKCLVKGVGKRNMSKVSPEL